VIGVLELLGIPYTGGSSYTTSLCLRKHAVNALLGSVGLPVPPWVYMTHGSRIRSPGFPCIVKPAAEDASIGVEQRSVVRSARALRTRVEAMIESFDEVIVQRYVEGRELNVGVLGDLVLPIAEIDFTTLPKGLWPIVTYRSKWDIGSEEDLGAVPKCPAQLPARVANEVRRVALEAWRIVGGHGGYGRIDMRLDHDMRPWILEVNANPDTEPEAGLARMARVAGIDYPAMCRRICELAINRKRQVEMTPAMWAQSQELSGMAVPGRDPAPAPELALFSGGIR
jgi:D-alanine-D-alanine ligase